MPERAQRILVNRICVLTHPELVEAFSSTPLLKKWQASIREIARDEKAVLVVAHGVGASRLSVRGESGNSANLTREARCALGRRVIFLEKLANAPSSPRSTYLRAVKKIFESRGFEVHEKTEIEGYGIFASVCVCQAVVNLGVALGIPLARRRINFEKSIM